MPAMQRMLMLVLAVILLQQTQAFAPPAFAPCASSLKLQGISPTIQRSGALQRRGTGAGGLSCALPSRAHKLPPLLCASADSADGMGAVAERVEPTFKVPIVAAAPGLAALIAFALPAVGMRITGPILSLIDTSIVGAFGNPSLLAAMTPGTIAYAFPALAQLG
ncbi:hypothetical protein T484DRAFT_1823849 [Baffinella frigidus]|nr:hypothetical protein T484DRAFT_1823849 [Cryptophyta sp. CCMP2293]